MLRELLFIACFAYIIGSIPTGYIIVKLFTGQDIRKVGSGSTGATNVKRVMGKGWFFTVMILDALKGALPVILTYYFLNVFPQLGIAPVIAAIFAILGHSKSVFLKFTGGKSVASGVGTVLALCFPAGIMVALIWAVVTWFSKYVSLGSIVAIWVSPFLMYFFKQPVAYIFYCIIGAIYITYLHRQNIVRLAKGEENKVRN